jgi:hypothetical protein
MTQLPPPVPVPSLAYYPPSQENAAVAVIRALAVGAIVLAGLQLIASACQLASSQGRSGINFGLRFNRFTTTSILAVGVELLVNCAAIAMIAAAIGCYGLRAWGRSMLLVTALVLVAAPVLQWGVRMVEMFGPSGPLSRLGAGNGVFYLLYTFSLLLSRLVFPIVLVWVLSRPAVRHQFTAAP